MFEISALILWFVYASIEGYRDGDYWRIVSLTGFKRNHNLMFIQRLSIGLALALMQREMILMLLVYGLTFSLWHNGFYYISRKDVYKKGFFDASKTSTAKMEFNFTTRLILFLIGILIFFI